MDYHLSDESIEDILAEIEGLGSFPSRDTDRKEKKITADDENIDNILADIEGSESSPIKEIERKVKERQQSSDKPSGGSGSIDVPPSDFRSRMNVEIQEIEDSHIVAAPQLVNEHHDTEEVASELINQFGAAIGQFENISKKILKDYEIDRLQAQAALDHYFETIEVGGKIPRVYIEKLADVLRAKNEIAMTPIRLLDSISKFMAASKNNSVLVQNVNANGPDLSNLENLLNQADNYKDETIVPGG